MPAWPEVISFEGLGPCFYSRGDFRAPRRGEFYASGAIVEGWRAPSDYPASARYRIIIPTHRALNVTSWQRGAPIAATKESV